MSRIEKSYEEKIEIFWSYVNKTDTCWLWEAYTTKHGYGQYGSGRRNALAHRFIWKHLYGEIGEGLQVCHKCDVRNCVNPEHLFLGTNEENTADREAKCRTVKGETHGMARLNKEDVNYIRNSYQRGTNAEYSMTGLSKNFGVSITQISRIINNSAWSA